MPQSRILSRDNAVLLIVDVQEAFRKYLPDMAGLAKSIGTLVQGCQLIGVPILVTEQYPKGLGKTVPEIAESLAGVTAIEKSCFSCCQSPQFMDELRKLNRNQIIVCGIEAHVCVNQTVHDLLSEGFQTHIVLDAIASRSNVNKEAGVTKMLSSGAIASTVEMSLFEMLYESGTDVFKAVQKLLK
ncbi:MAG TPA: hydrolase [Chroococcales cyanobacterium]